MRHDWLLCRFLACSAAIAQMMPTLPPHDHEAHRRLEHLERFTVFLKNVLQSMPVIEPLKKMIDAGTSKAGKRPEEVFTREFLCPTIVKYFKETQLELGLSDDVIESGLGTEGYKNCPGFGFTPASVNRNLFTKSDVIELNPPESWLSKSAPALPAFQACPDFAVRKPLPFSAVGEVKYFTSDVSNEKAARELFNAARQATFYLGAFRATFDTAILVLADASPRRTFIEGMNLIHPDLLRRFGAETGIHLVVVSLC